MALIEGGAARQGELLYAWVGGKLSAAKIVSPVFIDPEGKRQNV